MPKNYLLNISRGHQYIRKNSGKKMLKNLKITTFVFLSLIFITSSTACASPKATNTANIIGVNTAIFILFIVFQKLQIFIIFRIHQKNCEVIGF